MFPLKLLAIVFYLLEVIQNFTVMEILLTEDFSMFTKLEFSLKRAGGVRPLETPYTGFKAFSKGQW